MAGETVTLPETTVEGAAPAAPAETGPLFNPYAGGDFVAVRNRDGSFGAVQRQDLDAAVATGSKPASEVEWTRGRTGVLGDALAFGIGAGRGATFGASDAISIEGAKLIGGEKSAEEMRRALNLARQASPTATVTGDLVGSLAGMVAIPGSAGAGAARGASIGGRVLAAAPRLAAEGAIIGLGHQLSEDELGNHDLVAEQYISSAFKGAALGVIIGGALHGIGGAVGDRLGKYAGRSAEPAAGAAEAAEGGLLKRLGTKAADEAEVQAFKSTGAKLRDFQKLGATAEKQAEQAQRIGRKLLEEEIVTPLATQEKIAQRLVQKTKQVGEELGAMRATLDKATARPSMANIVQQFEERVLKPRLELPLGEAEAAKAAEYLGAMTTKGGESPTFATLFKFRKELDRLLDRGGEYARIPGGPAKVGAEALRDLRNIVEEEFTTAGERAAQELGGSFEGKYRLTKSLYADLITAQKIATKEAARANANQAISLTDVIAGGAGIASDGATGLLMGAANKVRRTFGNQIASHALDATARLMGIQRTTQSNTAAIEAGVKGFLSGARGGAVAPKEKVTAETARAVREAVRDPEAMVANIQERLGASGLSSAAPKVAQSIASTAMRAGSYLRDRTPKEPKPMGVSFIPQKPRPMSDSELAKYANAYEAVTDPMSVVEDLQRGQLDREKVTALKVVYPALYQQIRKEVIAQSIAMRPELSNQQQIALSILFDAPISAMMHPKVISSFQQTFAQGADPTQQAPGQASGQPAPTARGLGRLPPMASGFDKQEAPT